uniref:RRM domain-containing protein n=1 Tax=Plectus sambesii TaxID=2011161 RepID=A0A914UJ90_9BILA
MEHSSTNDDEEGEEEVRAKPAKGDEKNDAEAEEEAEAEPETTLFVKNLNFETTDESLRAKFEAVGEVRSAVVSKKRDPSKPTSTLSMGFGFVQYFRRADAQRALKELQGDLLDGHSLELKLSHRESTTEAGGKRKTISLTDQGDSTKLLVRNLPFQASRKELQQLFGAFGELRSLRIPKKTGSGDAHRGFGFVDYLTKADAKRAFEALVHSTHLYGRRLVLEWAKSEETLGELREKTAEHFATGADRRAVGKAKRKIAEDLAVIDDD